MRNLSLVTAPSEAEILVLVPIATIKENLRIKHSLEDNRISRAILDAFAYFDGDYGYLRRSVLTSSWKLTLPGFQKPAACSGDDGVVRTVWIPTTSIDIPLPPLQSIDTIRYRDLAGDWQTFYAPADSMPVLAPTIHISAGGGAFGRIDLLDGKDWPTSGVYPDAIEITFTAGYGIAADVNLKARGIPRAIAVLAADFYMNPIDTRDDVRNIVVNRKIANGIERSAGRYRFFLDMGYG